jgi:hypothetical protein
VSGFIAIRRLEFSVTYRCNSRCKHCFVGKEQRRSEPAAIDRDLAVGVVRRVTQRYAPCSIMTFGGEPLLYPDVTCAIHATATECGIPQRQVITNAGVPRSECKGREMAHRLAESGVNDIHISVDAFHQEHVPLEIVERNARAYADAGIPRLVWNPCWVVSADNDNPWNRRTREILDALAHLPVEMDDGNVVQPDGSALRWLASYLPPKVLMPVGSCEDVPYGSRLDEMDCPGIEPDGGVSICHDWTIGNVGEEDILEILERYDPYAIPEARAILQGGVVELVGLAHARGIELDPGGYYSICDLCKSIRKAMREHETPRGWLRGESLR